MIHGVVQDGTIVPLDPIPPDLNDGRQVVIEPADDLPSDERAQVERRYAELKSLGPALYEPGEREAFEVTMADAR